MYIPAALYILLTVQSLQFSARTRSTSWGRACPDLGFCSVLSVQRPLSAVRSAAATTRRIAFRELKQGARRHEMPYIYK